MSATQVVNRREGAACLSGPAAAPMGGACGVSPDLVTLASTKIVGSFNTASQLSTTTVTATTKASEPRTGPSAALVPAPGTGSYAGDSPAWTSTTAGWTRFVAGPGGALALQATGTGSGGAATSANLMLINPHGDIAATIPDTANVTAAQISGINTTDEYGMVLSTPAPSPYGWEGAAKRSTADQAGLILMGARQYNPATGRLLSLDPTPGGNPNPYTYPPDPVNGSDLSGTGIFDAISGACHAVVNTFHAVTHFSIHVNIHINIHIPKIGIPKIAIPPIKNIVSSIGSGISSAASSVKNWYDDHHDAIMKTVAVTAVALAASTIDTCAREGVSTGCIVGGMATIAGAGAFGAGSRIFATGGAAQLAGAMTKVPSALQTARGVLNLYSAGFTLAGAADTFS